MSGKQFDQKRKVAFIENALVQKIARLTAQSLNSGHGSGMPSPIKTICSDVH